MNQIETFLDEGITPFKKYYDELKQHFSVPSTPLLEFERKEFRKQIGMIRKAQKKELDQVKYMAMQKAKGVMHQLVDNANKTVKKEMSEVIKQYNTMSDSLFKIQKELDLKHSLLKTQETTLNELKIMLFQSISKQALKRDQIEKFDKWLEGYPNMPRVQEDIIDMVKRYLAQEKPQDALIEKEPFMDNSFSFHGSYIALSLRERESIITDDLVKYYKAQIAELKTRCSHKDMEIHSSTELNNYYVVQMNEMSEKISELRNTISELQKDNEYNTDRYEKQIKDINEEFMRKKLDSQKSQNQSNDVLLNEIQIREQIQLLLLDKQRKLEDEIKALKQILLVPKLQYKYLENVKLDSLKKQNDKIMKTEISKIAKNNDHIKSKKHHIRTERSLPPVKRRRLPSHRRSESTVDKSEFNNISSTSKFGFGEKTIELPQFINNHSRKKMSIDKYAILDNL